MYCASACGLPRSRTLELYTCASLTEPVQKCRRLNAHWQSDERRWCLHNNLVLRQLAQMLQRPLELVCRFLYQLTLKKFGEILNPKCSHWNWFRVPLVRPDTCGLYDGIFDTEGNLRNPLHPYILHILLVMMDHYLDLPCQGYADRRYSTVIEQIVTGSNQNKCTDIFADHDGRGAKLRQQWEADGGGKFGGSDYDDGEDKDGKDGKTKGDGDEGDKGDDEGGDGKETAAADDAANKRGGYGLKTGDGSGQDKAKQVKGAKTDDAKKAERKSMKDISNLYEKVVQNKHKRKLVNGPAAVEEDDDDYGYVPTGAKKAKPPKPPKKKKYKGTDQKYMGQMLPVLVHEPFDESKPWTWVRRHPRQERVLQGTHVGRINVHRYRRETLEMQFQQAKRTQSVASIYDGGSIESGAMFGYGSIKKKHAAMAKAFDYKRLLESPEEGMARITIAPKKPPKVPPKKQKAK